MTGAISKADRLAVDYVVRRYFREESDGWHQKRCDLEIAAYAERIESARSAGHASAVARKRNISGNDRSTTVQQPFNDRSTNQEPVTNNQEPKVKNKPTSAAPPDLPIAPELWEQFRESRKKSKAPMTPYAESLLIKELNNIQRAGGDPTATVEQSIKRGWKGFFPVEKERQKDQSPADKRAKTAAEMYGNRREKDERAIDSTAERLDQASD